MQPFANALLETLAQRRAPLVELLGTIVLNNPYPSPGSMTRPDLEQMIDGFVMVMKEALVGESEATRMMYLDTVIPGLLQATRVPIWGIMHTTIAWNSIMMTEVDRHIAQQHRDAARDWLGRFLGGWLTAIAKAGVEVGK